MSPMSPPPTVDPASLPPRQCGRCREMFDGDPTLEPAAQVSWWLCPPCRTVLLGDRPARSAPAGTQGGDRVPDAH